MRERYLIVLGIALMVLGVVLIACSTSPKISMPSKCITGQTAEWAWFEVPIQDGSRAAIVSKAFECIEGKWKETGAHRDLEKLDKLGLIGEQ